MTSSTTSPKINSNSHSLSSGYTHKNNNNNIHHNNDEFATIQAICARQADYINEFLKSEVKTPLLRQVQEQTRTTLGVMHRAFERYSLEEIALSYNGGKDCLVLLILFLSALAGAGADENKITATSSTTAASTSSSDNKLSSLPRHLPSVYVVAPDPFPEVDDFVTASAATYHLDLVRYSLPMKTAFIRYLEEHKSIKAILVGTRRTDPHGKFLTHFDMTDGGWPLFMRVHPVIDWHYSEIWAFIRHLKIPYCILYDRGFTSLGGTLDTHPNPALKLDGHTALFKPAYELMDDEEERLGRDDT